MAWVTGFYAFAIGAALALQAVMPPLAVPERLAGLWATLPLVVGALIASLVAVALRRNLAILGWPHPFIRVVNGGLAGLALGAGMAALALTVAAIGGSTWVGTGEPFAGYPAAVSLVLGGIVVAALGEELLFRGFPLAILAQAFGRVAAAGVLSVLFTLAHLGNPSVSALGLANILLASLVLSAAFFTPGALPAAWGLHAAWNGGLALADAPVSGIRFDAPAVDFVPGSRDWLTGGAFGPEGGAAATVALGGALVWLVGSLRRARETCR